ncbi:heat shock protein [Vanrija pseudolonga]|uniref:Heat shock protein n=1 Tax=Vanrija pseudolonga TaxID=143232 RepID=A0AAF1BFX1_9TREE|nr:heat shock protein [Vanrija pseudolonga]
MARVVAGCCGPQEGYIRRGVVRLLSSQHQHSLLFSTTTPTTQQQIANMADAGRQSLTDKAAAAVKPDSQKTYLEQASDAVASAVDSVASAVQPQQEKSLAQKAGDAVSGNNTNRDV